MSSLLFGITASDPATYATVLLVSLGGTARMLDSRAARREWIRWLRSGMNISPNL